MTKRERLAEPSPKFFSDVYGTKSNYQFVSSGCTILDCVLGGGYPLGRVVNIVGDKSTAKTALATEAIINFLRQYPNGRAAYRDAESAFDSGYAQAMGMPVGKVEFGDPESPVTTVEGFGRDFDQWVQRKNKHGSIYVLDSLDALSDEAEMARDLGDKTFGAAKAKQLSAFFRRLNSASERANCLLMIISQIRDNIGVLYGEKHSRSGGRALDFYASQIVYLKHMKTLKRIINKVERPVGIRIGAKVKKNKVGLALREAEFSFIFGYGIDDEAASFDWLQREGSLSQAEFDDATHQSSEKITEFVKKRWAEIETQFLPTRKKYA